MIRKSENTERRGISENGIDDCGKRLQRRSWNPGRLKTMIMNGVFGMSAVTALTAQNTIGVSGILAVDGDFLRRQIDAVFEDIRPDAVKIGMAVSKELIQVAAERLLFTEQIMW